VVKKIGDVESPYIENRLLELKELETAGTLVISRADSIRAAINRYRMSWILRKNGIPMPRTIVTESIDEAEEAIDNWGLAVVKPIFTSKGRGMIILSGQSAVRLTLRRWQKSATGPFYIQEFVKHSGRDVAVATLGNDVVASYYRVAAPGQWQTTTRTGGYYEACQVSLEVQEMAIAAVRLFDLDFSCVDMVETKDGWQVYEVSAFGGFSGLKKAHGIDAASLYADHVLCRLRYERG
jgi:ribosomal protein S6--L-glutamate ligase